MNRFLSFFVVGCVGLLCSNLAFSYLAPDAASATNPMSSLQESDISRFTTAISDIKDYYVEPANDKKLLEDAIRGMLSGLDPHSEYLDEDAYKTLLMSTTGAFGGLGIEVTGEFGVLKVISPIDDTPAAKAGIKPGDYIVAIDNKLVNEMSLREAVTMMRGKKGTPVQLTLIRKGEKKPLNLKLMRDEIRIVSVKGQLLPNGFGYVRISEFQQPTTELLVTEIKNIKKLAGGNLKGLILDLRNNPGGLLEVGVQVTDLFLDANKLHNQYNNLIVYTEGRLANAKYSAKVTAKSGSGDILGGAPLVILLNEGSASASEIVTGALQDYHRAVVVGIRSFGKGSVQTVLPLDNTHAIKLTTALYHTPAGRVIQNKGITPDVSIENMQIVPDKTTDTATLQPIREFELKGHLPGKGQESTSNVLSENDKLALQNIAQTDFQLYEAIKILKTMYQVNQNLAAATKAADANAATISKK